VSFSPFSWLRRSHAVSRPSRANAAPSRESPAIRPRRYFEPMVVILDRCRHDAAHAVRTVQFARPFYGGADINSIARISCRASCKGKQCRTPA
jgi:hypothetical protein